MTIVQKSYMYDTENKLESHVSPISFSLTCLSKICRSSPQSAVPPLERSSPKLNGYNGTSKIHEHVSVLLVVVGLPSCDSLNDHGTAARSPNRNHFACRDLTVVKPSRIG